MVPYYGQPSMLDMARRQVHDVLDHMMRRLLRCFGVYLEVHLRWAIVMIRSCAEYRNQHGYRNM